MMGRRKYGRWDGSEEEILQSCPHIKNQTTRLISKPNSGTILLNSRFVSHECSLRDLAGRGGFSLTEIYQTGFCHFLQCWCQDRGSTVAVMYQKRLAIVKNSVPQMARYEAIFVKLCPKNKLGGEAWGVLLYCPTLYGSISLWAALSSCKDDYRFTRIVSAK